MFKKLSAITLIISILLFLLIKPAEAIAASSTGLLLWFHSCIPALLPFLILSNLLIRMNVIPLITKCFYPLLHPVFGLSANGCYAFLTGFLCGYPMGAKTTAELIRNEKITLSEGQYLLSFCNNTSPAFLIGFCLTTSLNAAEWILPSMLIIYGSPLLLGLLTRGTALLHRHRKQSSVSAVRTQAPKKQTSGFQFSFQILDVCIMDGFETITRLGGYIILFSILAGMIGLLPKHLLLPRLLGIGICELTNGISAAAASPLPFALRYLLCMCYLLFGGLSITAQTYSLIADTGLSIRSYLLAKLLTLLLGLAGVMLLLRPLP